MKCSICGKEIVGSEPAVLFIGKCFDEKVICDACEKKFEILFSSDDKQKNASICNTFYEYSKRCNDLEVRDYLIEMLQSGGYILPKSGEGTSIPPIPAVESGWISMLRFIAWMEIIGGCISAVVLGVGLGEAFNEPALGVGIVIVGIIMSFILSAAIMVFLDIASDIRKIRQWMK